MLKMVYRPSRIVGGKRLFRRLYRGRYRLDADVRRTDVPLRTTEKRVAEKRLDELVRRVQLEREGLRAPESVSDAAQRPILEHLQQFITEKRDGRGRTRGYLRKVDQRVRLLARECGWRVLRDVTAESFETWRSRQTGTAKTLNEYLGAIRALVLWVERKHGVRVDGLARVERIAGGKQAFKRRALTDDEVSRLLRAAGPRAVVYLVALQTGFRRRELSGLQWRHVEWIGKRAVIRLPAELAKNRKADVGRLLPEVADALRELGRGGMRPDSRIFKGIMPRRETVAKDLEAGGICRLDAEGNKVDLHALRHTFITNTARAKMSGAVRKALARHSDQRLTDNVYTDVTQLAYWDELERMPRFSVSGSPIGSPRRGSRGRKSARGGTKGIRRKVSQVPAKTRDRRKPAPDGTVRHDKGKEWRRGGSNPRPAAVRGRSLHA